ncbi:UNVERIFIED_CONTAM: hypothetical protein O8I53_12075 [Campylobacter lari]
MISQKVKSIIENAINLDKLNHCYLLSTKSNLNLDETLIYIINKINQSEISSLEVENLPNNVLYFENELSKEKIVSVLENSALASFSINQKKIIILRNIQQASIQTLNSLLKNIEEPSADTVFILTTSNINKVLDTIKSRSVKITITKPTYAELQKVFIEHNYDKPSA